LIESTTADLGATHLRRLRRFLDDAFAGDFGDEDFEHALGGRHFWIEDQRGFVAHASVVTRILVAGGRPLLTGYVEAVATRPDARRRGRGRAVMEAAADFIHEAYEIGALSSNLHELYERLGWERWLGPTGVLENLSALGGAWVPTPDDDGGIFILRTPQTPQLDLYATLVCEARRGDPW
jgi:aminoglycoside 2'-N-acetyltransferase I